MTSKIEEAAKAQQDALAEIFASQKPWDKMSLPEQAARVVAQKAAMQALREPDEAMMSAGVAELWSDNTAHDNFLGSWQAGIDAILQEGE